MASLEIEQKAEERRRKILNYLKKQAKSVREISEELGVFEGTIRNDVYILERRKLVESFGEYPALWDAVKH